jgi:hypothetical protein
MLTEVIQISYHIRAHKTLFCCGAAYPTAPDFIHGDCHLQYQLGGAD